MKAWPDVLAAIETWTLVRQSCSQLGLVARITIDKRIVMTADDAAHLPADVWTLAQHGLTLSLPASLSDYMERKASRDQQRQALAAEAEKRRDKEQHGVAV